VGKIVKTVVIGGVCRTGKSRLANKVFQNTKATVFHGDHLMNILYNNFPDSVKDNFPKVLIKLIRNMGKEFNYTRIFESCHDDESLISHIKNYAELSREHQLKCQQAEIPYFDTSDNFNYVWNQAYDYVIQKLGS
jgi:2-phosphoglycerate kinase